MKTLLFLLLACTAQAQTWVKGEIGFRLSIIPSGSPADRAGLKIGDILANPPGVRAVLQSTGELPVYRLNGMYRKTTVKISFKDGEERRLGVTGDLGFLITALIPETPPGLRAGDFLPKIDDRFVHEIPDLTLPKDREAAIHVTRWENEKRVFEQLVVRHQSK